MYLKAFVADVISQITDGVVQAINHHDSRKVPGKINPVFQDPSGEYDWKSAVQNIEFDISVTASAKSMTEGGGGVKIYVAELNAKGSKVDESSTVNKIKFTIPVSLPAHAITPGIEWSSSAVKKPE